MCDLHPILFVVVSCILWFISNASFPGPLKSKSATQATASFLKIRSGFGLVARLIFISAASSSGSRSLSSAKPR